MLPRDIPEDVATYDDMTGVVLVGILFAFSFVLRGRIEFGNIYGFGLTGSIWIYFIINLMAQKG
jgi:protein YIPF5/7